MNGKCGCKYKLVPKGLTHVWAIVFCDLHASAGAMREALEKIVEGDAHTYVSGYVDIHSSNCPSCLAKAALGG